MFKSYDFREHIKDFVFYVEEVSGQAQALKGLVEQFHLRDAETLKIESE